jgi:cell division protein FtsZ
MNHFGRVTMAQYESKLDALKFEIHDEAPAGTKIKVIGVGGAGCNAAGRMYQEGVPGVEFHVINTDRQALSSSPAPNRLLIGQKVTNGLGAGSDPNVGREAALEDTERIVDLLQGADMVFVAAGMGGGTGTGAAPVVASLAKELNALTVAIVTKPFVFEGTRRMKVAEKGIADLAATVDTLIQIPNERLTALVPKGTPLMQSFKVADDVLQQAVQGISDIMNTPGIINRDFSDIRAIMQGMGYAMMGTATASGENAALEAARKAVHSPMLEEEEMRGARGVLVNITGSSRISLHDVNEACTLISKATQNDDVQLNFGIVLDEALGEEVKVTVIATGFPRLGMSQPAAPVHVQVPAPAPVVVREERKAMAAVAGVGDRVGVFTPPVAVQEPEPEPLMVAQEAEPEGEPARIFYSDEPARSPDDLEVPAFLRNRSSDRRYLG